MKKLLVIGLCAVFLGSCAGDRITLPKPSPPPPAPPPKKTEDYKDIKKYSYRSRLNVPTNQSRYEGSLWKDEASWGNLLRDHRARFRGDLVKITDLQNVISIPKKKEPLAVKQPTALAAVGEAAAGQITEVLEAASGVSKAEEEQNEVMASLRSISAYVQSVLPNGNMVIVGEKIDYRQQNTVRYVTTIKGIIRPSDVNNNNEVPAVKLARFEPKTRRQMLSKNIKALGPVMGTKKAGLFDRLSHMATPGKSKTVRKQ
ncbi:MAG: flagellar basal body L-ring protein FlgH [Proteobacteria bacterium]|nr:flagellar basal body L-ring protein FlgH [Pseudomonadota bacterium]